MKKMLLFLLWGGVLLLLAACAPAAEDGPEAIAAVVNGVELPQAYYDQYFSDFFNDFFNTYYTQYQEYYGIDLLDEESAKDTLAYLEQNTWEAMLQSELIRQIAQEDYGITLAENYLDTLLLPGIAANLRTNLYYYDILPLIQEEAQAQKVIGEAEARAAYEANPTAWDSRQVAQITILAETEADRPIAEEQAQEIIQQLRRGADFEELAREYGQDATAAEGGSMTLYFNLAGEGVSNPSGSVYPEFAAAAFALTEIGDYTMEPVASSAGYHVVKLTDMREGFEALKEMIIANLTPITNEEVTAYFQQKIDEKMAASVIERRMEFRYYNPQQDTAEPPLAEEDDEELKTAEPAGAPDE